MPGKNYPKTEDQADLQQVVQQQIVNEQTPDINPVLETLKQVFSTFQGRFHNHRSNPFEGAAMVAVDTFNDIVAGLKLKYPPDKVTITAKVISSSEVELGWENNTHNLDGFKIMRCQLDSTQSCEFSMIAQLPGTAKAYRDINLFTNTCYRYKLLAFNYRGETPSDPIEITPTLIRR